MLGVTRGYVRVEGLGLEFRLGTGPENHKSTLRVGGSRLQLPEAVNTCWPRSPVTEQFLEAKGSEVGSARRT